MVKFNVLQSNQHLLAVLQIHSNQNEAIKNRVRTIFIHFILFAEMYVIIHCLWKLGDSSTPFADKVNTFQLFFPLCQAFGMYVNVLLKMETITALNEKLQLFVNAEGLYISMRIDLVLQSILVMTLQFH